MSSIARHHAEWLSLLEINGPFLSLPVLMRVFPEGLDAPDSDLTRDLRLAYEEWLDNQGGLRPDTALHHAWVEWVLRNVLEMPDTVLRKVVHDDPWSVTLAEHGETLRPDFAIVEPRDGKARLLVAVVPPKQDLDKPLAGAAWVASPATRLMTLLHGSGVRLGLVTNGERWMLVDAPKGETTGYTSWYAELWLAEPLTLRAFRSLLRARRFFGVPDDKTIEGLLAQSVNEQQEVTDRLGSQVRRAVEMLVQAVDVADQDRGRTLLKGVSEGALYEAALTVMMRLVFLLSAEENDLLLLGDRLYDESYAVSTLRAQLHAAADREGEEVLERRFAAWSRVLATFRAVYGGVQHDRMTLPAYGGDLFKPDRFEFLEGRAPGSRWETTPADPLPISDRTVLHLLDALQVLQMQAVTGGPTEARRLSFRALDIEQIGHVYEGLLDHQAVRASEPVLGLGGSKEPEIALAALEEKQARGEAELVRFLKEETGRTENALRNALQNGNPAADDTRLHRLRIACRDDALYARVLPFAGLVRDDDYGHPVVILPGSVYVTAGAERRATGTHYTPRSLTEPIVRHTLEPLVYRGPAEGKPREEWRLRSADEILNLKVCDMAMGSGAFLVQACRYLSERLVEAWERDPHPGPLPEGGGTSRAERLAHARRLVAARCLYGVDKNALAVEMAKLSLWLITLNKGEAFTFLDHALKCGDSLVGVDLDQLTAWSLTGAGKQWETAGVREEIEEVIALRREIEATPVRGIYDIQTKSHLLARAEAVTQNLRTGGDLLVGSYFNDLGRNAQDDLRVRLLAAWRKGLDIPERLARQADLRNVNPFHWHLEFPEVFLAEGRRGFDAFVGNPPFIGGQRISGLMGASYLTYLKTRWSHARGSADYCAYFFLRGFEHLQMGGALGLIATNTIAQAATRELGLDYIDRRAGKIYCADNNYPWPGAAAVVVDVVHVYKGRYTGECLLDGKVVPLITPLLDDHLIEGQPYVLSANSGKSFQGSNVLGVGFTMPPDEAQALLSTDARNADVLFPYLNGEDLNSRPDQSPSRWVIDFHDWSLQAAQTYADCYSIIERRVKPERERNKYSQSAREKWWQYERRRPELYRIIKPLRRVLVIALTSNTMAFTFMPKGMVYSHATVVLAFEQAAVFGLLQATIHTAWARKYGSSMKGDSRYTPTDCFENFPFPAASRLPSLEDIGEAYHEHRRQIMLARQEGLTATYNRFHNPDEAAADIARLRELHVTMDEAVARAYGWDDLRLEHGFHTTPQGTRYTISEAARREVLARLLKLNHERYAEEVAQGLHKKDGKTGKGKAKGKEPTPTASASLFGED